MKTQKHIFIDGREANTTQRVGSNTYAFQVISHVYTHWQDRPDIQVTVGLADEPVEDMPKPHKNWRYEVITPKPLWTQWALPLHLWLHRNTYQVVFSPSHYAPRVSPVPTIITIFDLAFLHFPNQFKKRDYLQLKNWTKYSAKQARKIITISDYSKQSIIDSYSKKSEDIVIAYPSYDATTLQLASEKNQLQEDIKVNGVKISPPFLLYVGTIQPRKNIDQMIAAFEQIKRQIGARSLKINPKQYKELDKLQFVIAGKTGWLAEPILTRIAESPFSADILVTGYIEELTKWQLLSQAMLTFQLGTHEGFGIPALEALAAGSLVIASNNASLPEVVGDAGILVKPDSSYSLQNALKKSISLSAKEKAEYRKKAREQVEKFSWQETAHIIAETIEETVVKQYYS
jgi:glycosyltransferase involved in cell wall biosynthesis